jgi:hypothetical protein
MDRMSFIPGPKERELLADANGLIFFDKDTAIDFAEEFLSGHSLLYQTVLACMSDGDRAEIKFGLRDPKDGEELDPSGELIGYTWATFIPAVGPQRMLWETGRKTEPIRDVDATRAFNAYRAALAAHQGISAPSAVPEQRTEIMADKKNISRALSPSHLYYSSGIVWYFIDLSMTAPSREEHLDVPLKLSRPMNAFDTLVLATLLTLAMDAPPLVFGVYQIQETLGNMPDEYINISYAVDYEDKEHPNRLVLIG